MIADPAVAGSRGRVTGLGGTPAVNLSNLVGTVMILLMLFGITLIGVGGYFFLRVFRDYRVAKPAIAYEKKATAAIESATLGQVAVVCGPLLGLVVSFASLPLLLFKEPRYGFYAAVKWVILMTAVGAVAGVILGGAFWVSSACLGNVRKAAKKRLRGVLDPEFDGPL